MFHRNKIMHWTTGLGCWLLAHLIPLCPKWEPLWNTNVILFSIYDDLILNTKAHTATAACSWLTHGRHFGNSCGIGAVQEFGFIVIDVLNLDDELWLRLNGLVGEPVQGLGSKRVVGLLLAVQPLGGVNIPGILINNENGTCPFAWQDVFDGTISFINIRVKLVKNSCEMRLTYKRVSDTEICKNNSYVRQQNMKFYCSWKDKLALIVHSGKAIRMCQLALVSNTISFLPVNSLISKGILYHSHT